MTLIYLIQQAGAIGQVAAMQTDDLSFIWTVIMSMGTVGASFITLKVMQSVQASKIKILENWRDEHIGVHAVAERDRADRYRQIAEDLQDIKTKLMLLLDGKLKL